MPTFTDLVLRRGDDDAAKRWEGSIHPGVAGTPVRDLQAALASVGILDSTPNGSFGGDVETAVRRFQWNIGTVKNRIVAGALQARVPTPVPITGRCDAATSAELAAWIVAKARATGNLARSALSRFAQFVKNFTPISNPSIGPDDIVTDADFASGLDKLNTAARDANVTLLINQAFRVAGAPVHGAVVPPATKSQHLIGHAIDCNVNDHGKIISSSIFAAHGETPATKKFVAGAKASGLRWGGDFATVDFVHFDDFVNPDGEEYLMRFFFNQRMIQKNHPLP